MKNYICTFLAFMLVLGGCMQKEPPMSSSVSSSGSQAGAPKSATSIPDEEESSIVNLPSELYQVDESAYADMLRHDFKVEEKTEFAITVEVTAGKFSMGIKDRDSKGYVYAVKEFETETDSVTLEKGSYSIEIAKSEFTGSYRIKGAPTE